MNSIIGFSSLMMTEFDNPEVKMMASRILGAGNRLLKTLDDILELTQLQSGIEPWKLGVVDLEADVSKLIDKFHEEAESKGLLMEFRSSASSSMAVPRDLVSKAIGELISNAIKFTGNGRIRVCLEDFFENGRRNARVLVSDTGIGIEPENHEVVFESFRQLSTGYGRSHEGSGLGLTLARKIAEILGGSLTLMSKPGEGSTFTLILPLSENGILKEPVKFEPRPDEIIRQRQSVTRPEILLVEDNEDNILVVREFLKKDYSITAVNSGDEAISVARSKQFDLVLMDINLGVGTDGLSAAREIKSKGASQAAIIVAITGYTLKDDMDRILSQGCDYYLGKPFSRSQIKGLLQQLV
jgi:CheY-like chemotaxis protein